MAIQVKATQSRRCRAGHCFTDKGETFDREDFDEDQWKAIDGDPVLILKEVPDGERGDDDAPRQLDEDEQMEMVQAAIKQLRADGYTGQGKPKVADVRMAIEAALPDDVAAFDVDAKLIELQFTAMTTGGFQIPTE